MKQSVSKEYWFEMAHRLKSEKGHFYPKEKCGSLHGHSIKVTIVATLAGQNLNEYGFVTDFSDFKILKNWIDENLDHATLVGGNDHDLIDFLKTQGDRLFIFPKSAPSSENLALVIMEQAKKLLENERIRITEVRVSETCSSEAIVSC